MTFLVGTTGAGPAGLDGWVTVFTLAPNNFSSSSSVSSDSDSEETIMTFPV